MSRRLLAAAAIAAASLPAQVAGAAAASGQPPGATLTSACTENQAFVDGDPAAVAAVLPAHYTAVLDPATSRPLLFFRAEHCDSIATGLSDEPGTIADFGVVVQSPDGIGCASAAPVLGMVKGDVPPVCNWYTLAWLSTDPALVRALEAGLDDFPAVQSSSLAYSLGALDPASGGAPFHFDAPASTGTPFAMDSITRARPGQLSVRGGYWTDVAQGTVEVAVSSDTLSSGDATGTVSAPAGTPVARLLGGTQAQFLPGYSALSAERWDRAVYRRQLLWPAPGETSFSGSCSLQGTVTFDPPAGDVPQPLAYSYDATGTCTGTLDGRTVNAIPVTVHHAGHSEGGCIQAQTTDVGTGAVTFASGESIDYTVDFTTDLTTVSFTIYGARSGIAPGSATFVTSRTAPDISAQCATQSVQTAAMDASLSTQTPLVSLTRPRAATGCAGCREVTAAAVGANVVASPAVAGASLPETAAADARPEAGAAATAVLLGIAVRGRRRTRARR